MARKKRDCTMPDGDVQAVRAQRQFSRHPELNLTDDEDTEKPEDA
jgi:hypothetical protein